MINYLKASIFVALGSLVFVIGWRFRTTQEILVPAIVVSCFLIFFIAPKYLEPKGRKVRTRGTWQDFALSYLRGKPRANPQIIISMDDNETSVDYFDIKQIVTQDWRESSIAKQEKWLGTFDRMYLDHIRFVLVESGAVRQKGNGALVKKFNTYTQTLEQIQGFYKL